MSLVLWYSIVPFQCRNVCRWICLSLGFPSLLAVLLLRASKFVLRLCAFPLNILSVFLDSLFSMSMSLVLRGSVLLLLPFSAVMLMVLRSESMCIHFNFSISPILAPVSLSSCSNVAILRLEADISASISCSVGMK